MANWKSLWIPQGNIKIVTDKAVLIQMPRMGQGLVGWYANQAGKPFVGTELNSKRLAILVESIETNKKLQGKRKSK